MTKKLRFFLIAILASLVLVLSGCGAKADSENTYKLPLGDSGYMSEIDFKLTNSYAYHKNDNGVYDEWVAYKYITIGKNYTVSVEFGKTETGFTGKSVALYVGYYENEDFVPVANSGYLTLSSDNFVDASFAFDCSREDLVVKLDFGTKVDKEAALAKNASATTSELNNLMKQYHKASLVVRSLAINETGSTNTNSILTEPVVDKDGNVLSSVGKQNSDLYYFNTATVTWSADAGALGLTLNYKGGPWQWVIKELGALLNWITQLVGGIYWLGLLILTLIVRTAAWPIYAKSNTMSVKMSAIQPEMDKINQKYEGKTDQNSKMKQQMELRELMKKNHVSALGCLMPLLQMPIFLAIYQVVERFPLTPLYDKVTNFKFIWTDFSASYGTMTGDWILAILVGITMVASQELGIYMSKRIAAKKRNFYTAKAQQSNTQMRIMSGVMTVMMVVFAWRSAGMAFYWIIGNVYQILQTYVSKIQEEKAADKAQKALGRPEGR